MKGTLPRTFVVYYSFPFSGVFPTDLAFCTSPFCRDIAGAEILCGRARDTAAREEGQLGHDARYGGGRERDGAYRPGRPGSGQRGRGEYPAPPAIHVPEKSPRVTQEHLSVSFFFASPMAGWVASSEPR